MKVLPFKIPKPEQESIIVQEDVVLQFYDKLHQHEEIQISWIKQGEGTLIVGETVSHFKTNDILVIGSNVPHVFKTDHHDNQHQIMISLFFHENSFGNDFFNQLELISLKPILERSQYGFKWLNPSQTIFNLLENTRTADKLTQFINLFKLLKEMRDGSLANLSSINNTKQLSSIQGQRLRAVFAYSLNHFNDHISLDQIANVANMSKHAFCKYFKQHTNKTYIQFLTEIRIENAAKLLLKNKDLAIADVAIASGFNNISNFNKKFKSIKKRTPLKFKQQL